MCNGIVLKNLNKLDEAIEYFDKLIKLNPIDSLAFCNKGIALYKLNKFKESFTSGNTPGRRNRCTDRFVRYPYPKSLITNY